MSPTSILARTSTRIVVCSCGWRGNPQITAVAAIKERQAHYEQQRRRPAVQEDS